MSSRRPAKATRGRQAADSRPRALQSVVPAAGAAPQPSLADHEAKQVRQALARLYGLVAVLAVGPVLMPVVLLLWWLDWWLAILLLCILQVLAVGAAFFLAIESRRLWTRLQADKDLAAWWGADPWWTRGQPAPAPAGARTRRRKAQADADPDPWRD